MAKWKSAIFSDIRNKLGESVVFSMWKGRPYMRSYVKPANPKSDAQTANRLHMAALVVFWQTNIATVSAAVTAWNKAALATLVSGYNLFIKESRGFVVSGVTLASASFAFTLDSVSGSLSNLQYVIRQPGAPAPYVGGMVALGAVTAAAVKGSSAWSASPDDEIYVVDNSVLGSVTLTNTNFKQYCFPVYVVDETAGTATPMILTT